MSGNSKYLKNLTKSLDEVKSLCINKRKRQLSAVETDQVNKWWCTVVTYYHGIGHCKLSLLLLEAFNTLMYSGQLPELFQEHIAVLWAVQNSNFIDQCALLYYVYSISTVFFRLKFNWHSSSAVLLWHLIRQLVPPSANLNEPASSI